MKTTNSAAAEAKERVRIIGIEAVSCDGKGASLVSDYSAWIDCALGKTITPIRGGHYGYAAEMANDDPMMDLGGEG